MRRPKFFWFFSIKKRTMGSKGNALRIGRDRGPFPEKSEMIKIVVFFFL